MNNWICTTCGTQFAPTETPPQGCPICLDNRQYVGYEGQKWTTLANMRKSNFHNKIQEHEPRLFGIGTKPTFAIGQRALLVQTAQGNILWDCISFLDDETIAAIQQRGGIRAIAISHPHFYSSMIEWANAFDARIYLHEADRQWIMRPDERITFWSDETLSLQDDITLVRLGGHFPGSTVLHWAGGSDGKGLLLTGDTIQVVADHNWMSFMYSYPNFIPLPASVVSRMRDTIAQYRFERLYGMRFESVVAPDARDKVIKSANRYIQALEQPLS